jgi:hypothetical protein
MLASNALFAFIITFGHTKLNNFRLNCFTTPCQVKMLLIPFLCECTPFLIVCTGMHSSPYDFCYQLIADDTKELATRFIPLPAQDFCLAIFAL